MANPLKDIFSVDEPEYLLSVEFENEQAYQNFIEQLNSSEDGFKFDGVKQTTQYIKSGTSKQKLDEHKGITHFYVSPKKETVPIEIVSDFGPYTFNFVRIEKPNEIVLKTEDDDIVSFRFSFPKKSETFNLSYSLNPTKADNIEQIIKKYNAAIHLIKKFRGKKANEYIDNELSLLQNSESYWNRVYEVEKVLEIEFNPSKINDTAKDKGNIEQLYLLLVKKLPICLKLNHFTATAENTDDFDKSLFVKGANIATAYSDSMLFEIYGEKLNIFTMNYIFNSIVESIIENSEARTYKVKYVGTESDPLKRVYLGYKTLNEIPDNETMDFNETYRRLSNAKTFNELMDDMDSEYHTSIRMK